MAGFPGWLRGLFGGQVPVLGVQPVTTASNAPPAIGGDVNDFALALYGRLRQQPGNLFFSPFSIRTALAMLQEGASGETAAQIGAILGTSSSDEASRARFAATERRLSEGGGDAYEIAVANSLWGQEGASLRAAFLDGIERRYGGTMRLVDFERDADAARAHINRWVEDATRQQIRDLIPPGRLRADTRLALVNAVYLKAPWMLSFREAATQDELFHLAGGGQVLAPLMYQCAHVGYLEAAGFKAVDLAYRGADLSMLVLLPERRDRLADLERRLSAHMLHDTVARMDTRQVELYLPRFRISWSAVDLHEELAALGMPLPFSDEADFSGINGCKPPQQEALHVSAVLHKAFVEANEAGTEAAAATILSMEPKAARPLWQPPRPPIFRADHPFLLAIRDRRTGVILFLGRVADPTREDR